MTSYKFSTMTTEQLTEETKASFQQVLDDVWISKESFTVQLDSKDIKLHLFIEYFDMSEYTDDNTSQEVSIGIIPSFDSLTEKNQKSILQQYSKEEQEHILCNPISLLYEVMSYGFKIALHTETTQDVNRVDHLIHSAMAVSPCVSGLIGFDLDRIYNRIGNTGWDFLSDYCEGKDLLQLVMERY